jgi:hypothetical protein
MSLNPPLPDPSEQIGYPLENGEPESMIFWNLPCMAIPPGGVAVQVGFRRLVDCCHLCTAAMSIVISHDLPLHNSLPTLSLGFILFFPTI